MAEQEVIVAGGGAAGLAAAAGLQRRGKRPLVLDKGEELGSSWAGRYDTLRLNTLRVMSTLAGYRMPRRYGDYPTKDDVAEYLRDYAREEKLDVRLGVTVGRINRADDGWQVETTAGPMIAPRVVVATGFDVEPRMPKIPGIESYTGELIHAREYRGAEPFRGRDVLVIGGGNTGTEIAFWLLEGGASRVRVSMRTPPNIFPRNWLGAPLNPTAVLLERLPEPVADRMAQLTQRLIYGDLSRYGIPKAPHGPVRTIRVGMTAPAIDCGFVDAVKQGRIEIVGTVERFDAAELVMSDGPRTAPDVVIAATGYSRGLEPIVGHLGVLDEHGNPRAPDGRADPAVPGLYFVGYVPRFSGQLREARLHARRLARSVTRDPVPA